MRRADRVEKVKKEGRGPRGGAAGVSGQERGGRALGSQERRKEGKRRHTLGLKALKCTVKQILFL